jgi:SAM-dependent methyltransferase
MMGQIKLLIRNWVVAILYPKPLIGLLYLPRFFRQWIEYALKDKTQRIRFLESQPCFGDWNPYTPFDPHYFYQGAWLARQLVKSIHCQHVDVGSSVLTMSVLSAWTRTIFVDYRPLRASLTGLVSLSANILQLPFPDGSVQSLSCLHVIEHIGLGRYGDPIDPKGSVSAACELQRILKPGGKLYISLPIGHERVCFNAHRVHAPVTVSRMFSELRLVDFSYVDDEGVMRECEEFPSAKSMKYGCGMFLFEKPTC